MKTWRFGISLEGSGGKTIAVELTETQSLLHLHDILVEACRLDAHASYSIYLSGLRNDVETEYGEMKDHAARLASRTLLRGLGLKIGQRILHVTRMENETWHMIEPTGSGERLDDVRYPRVIRQAAAVETPARPSVVIIQQQDEAPPGAVLSVFATPESRPVAIEKSPSGKSEVARTEPASHLTPKPEPKPMREPPPTSEPERFRRSSAQPTEREPMPFAEIAAAPGPEEQPASETKPEPFPCVSTPSDALMAERGLSTEISEAADAAPLVEPRELDRDSTPRPSEAASGTSLAETRPAAQVVEAPRAGPEPDPIRREESAPMPTSPAREATHPEGWLPGLVDSIRPAGLPSTGSEKPKVGRNDPCPCGSGRKYKKCCLPKDT